jgi:septal ring-binding cell division protein DamX
MKIAAEAAPTGVLLLVSFSVSADYQDGLDAYTFGDYATAMSEWQAVVATPPEDVNPAIYAEAHYAIAKLYWQGDGVAQDFRAAYEWLLKAAELGHAGAQAKLGFMYTDGLVVRQDFSQAFDWYDKAAKGGNVDGLYNLGIFYYYGWGIKRDLTMAAQYLAAASALGDAPSEEALQQVLAEIDAEKAPPVEGRLAAESLNVDWQPNLAEHEAWALSGGAETSETNVDAEPDIAAESSQQSHERAEISNSNESAKHSQAMPAPTENSSPAGDGLAEEATEPQTATAPAPEPADPVWRDEAWIAAQDPDHFTIQVMALSDLALLRQQITGFESLAPFAIYTVQKTTSPLHVLVQGSYPDVASARAAQNSFPRKIQKRDKLWIRRFEMVQRLLE